MTSPFRKLATATSICLLTLSSTYNSYAAPGTLPTVPLFNTNLSVEPNVFFTIDDSGSMDWELIFSQGATSFATDQGLPIIGGSRVGYMIPSWSNNVVPSLANDPNSWIFRNFNANALYYDSVTDYDPWKGYDAAGNRLYTDADPTSVRENPNSSGNTLDITSTVSGRYIPTFCTWDDDPNGNGIDESDPHTCIEIRPGNEALFPSGRTYNEEIQNFANWLQFFRKREYSAKHAIGSVINATDEARMGMRLINSGQVQDLSTMTDDTNKLNLLQDYYADSPSGSTPLRQALQRVGEMFSDAGSGAILPQADGGECQQNFNILMTDGYWNGSNPSGIGNEDGDNNTDFDGNPSQSIDQGNYGDNYSPTLADVAMYYYENDLRPDLADDVPTSIGVDLADHQHLVNYTIAFGLRGTLDITQDPTESGFAWTDPTGSSDPEKIDDMWHTAYNSRGLYLSADNSQVLLDSLLTAVTDITDRATTAAAAAVTSAKLTTETIVYLAEYNTVKWQGDILAHRIANFDTGELVPQPEWSAAQVLNNRDIDASPRTVLTYNNVVENDGIAFQWDELTEPQKDDLRTTCTSATTTINPPPGSCILQFNKAYCPVTRTYYNDTCTDGITTGTRWDRKYYCYDPTASSTTVTPGTCSSVDPDDKAMARLNFIRGDRSEEGTGYDFRERATLLGDIVNAGPVYVGAPSLNIPDDGPFPTGGNAYSNFKEAQENRTGVVYAGANDGMFHAFHEDDGRELFAYIPSYLFSTEDKKGLHYLTEKKYNHMFYNDLTATVADVFINSGGGSGWRTVLIAGQRGGGRGYFALDVTNPSSFSEDNAESIVMWEFSSQDDADLGYTYSRPQIGMMDDGTWVAIFGNGYNSTGDGEAKLFIVKLEGGVDGEWTEGTDYYKISTGTGSTGDPNGLATPALADIDGNGTIDRAYAGDLNGDMWAFDLSDTFGSGTLAYGSTPLFSTEGNQPITSKPILSFHPTEPTIENSNEPNLMVFFGSGQFLVTADKSSTEDDFFYGVWDRGTAGLTRSDLVEQTYRTGFTQRVLTKNAVDYAGGDFGWNIALPDSGERSITNPAVRGDIVLFNSSVPISGPCSSGGYGYRFAVDLATGGTPDEPVLDMDKDGEIDSNDTIGEDEDVPSADQLTTLPTDNTFTEKVGYTGKDPFAISELKTPKTGRFSWQELLQ